jgi:hypothetical protein
MARLIECSHSDVVGCDVSLSMLGKLKFRLPIGWNAKNYKEADIETITPIDEEKYRSGGRAAAGAIIGGVLTGGLGFLAGAAIGGRRRKTGTYLVTFKDGSHVAFEEKSNSTLKVIDRKLESGKVKSLVDRVANKTPE